MAEVVFNHIVKKYPGNAEATVKDFHLEIRDREFLVLVGASGCGKSTTLRMVAGLESITAGELYIGGRLMNDVAPKDRDIAMVFQSYALYPHMNVYDNMAFGLKMRKFKKAEIDARVRAAANILDIGHVLDRKPKALSGGQRQRVALGRAMVREPQVFLMDEPLSNLDAKLRVQMRAEIGKLARNLGVTVIYVTHDQTEAMTMGDRIVVMDQGMIQQAATPEEIYNRPVNMFVAGFIGSPAMNFIRGGLEESEGRLTFRAPGLNAEIPQDRAETLRRKGYAGKEAILGIRPEHIHPSGLEPVGSARAAADALIEVAENLGNEMILYLKGIGQQNVTARIGNHAGFQEGNNVKLSLDMNKAHFFDQETTASILP
ncbi:ABC transporter ATP-binding protein [Paenibacillus glucanolyticus]|uniref:ABC transporter ATP-binding protein n=1 Tax=Paenibacillus glucanolyticus TaxID=59843 RepID=UPI003D021BEF